MINWNRLLMTILSFVLISEVIVLMFLAPKILVVFGEVCIIVCMIIFLFYKALE